MFNLDLEGKCAIVTGGTRNLGRAIVLAFLREGMKVVTNYRSDTISAEEFFENVPTNLNPSLRVKKLDISSNGDCQKLCSLAMHEFRRLDVLVNNAAIILSQTPDEISDDDFDLVLRNTLRGVIYMTRAAFSIMKSSGGGRIVNMSTAGVYTANPNELLYLCAKAGLEGATRSFARLGARHKITVNAIAPHVIASGMGSKTLMLDPTILQRIPLGRTGTVEEFVRVKTSLAPPKC